MLQSDETNSNSRMIKRLVICALLTALGVIFGGLLSIPAVPLGGSYSLKIGIGVLPVIISGVLYGPLYGGMVGGLTDLIQALLFPKGAYVPWFTIVGIGFGLIPGLFFIKRNKPTFCRLLIAITAGQLICSVGLNTWLLTALYALPWQLVYVRLVNQLIMIPLYTVLVYYIIRLLDRSGVIKTQ